MIIAIIIILSLLFIFLVINFIRKRFFVRLFSRGNVLVSGLRGRGKDVAFCIVINSRKRNYISNVQYSSPRKKFQRFDFDPKVWELAKNTHNDLVTSNIKPYTYPYPDNIDYYISDAGVYFPSQYQSDLCKRYPSAPLFQALSRHLGDCNIHCNVQRQNRLWDKLREQSDIFIVMRRTIFIPHTKICLVWATEYELAESAELQLKLPFFGIGKTAREAKNNFMISHGQIKKHFFVTRLPYRYDSRRFKRILENNCVDYEV